MQTKYETEERKREFDNVDHIDTTLYLDTILYLDTTLYLLK